MAMTETMLTSLRTYAEKKHLSIKRTHGFEQYEVTC